MDSKLASVTRRSANAIKIRKYSLVMLWYLLICGRVRVSLEREAEMGRDIKDR